MTPTSIVILNFNGETLLRQFMPSVTRYAGEATVIVADNGSTDGSVATLRESFPGVIVNTLGKNLGFCAGYNRALDSVETPYTILLNSDVEVKEGWVEGLVRLMDSDTGLAAAQPGILSFTDPQRFDYAGAAGGLIDALGYPFCRGRLFNRTEVDRGQYGEDAEIFWATGACMVVRTAIYKTLGGFDEHFFAHMEEVDLCWRMHRAGYRIGYCAGSKVYHLGGATLSRTHPRKTYLNFRNGLCTVFYHWSSGELIWKFPLRMIMDLAASGVLLLRGRVVSSLSMPAAYLYFLTRLGRIMRRRKDLNRRYPPHPGDMIYRGLIAYDYFIRWRSKIPNGVPPAKILPKVHREGKNKIKNDRRAERDE